MMELTEIYEKLNKDGFVLVEITKGRLNTPYVGKKGKLVKIKGEYFSGKYGVVIQGHDEIVFFMEDEIEFEEDDDDDDDDDINKIHKLDVKDCLEPMVK